MTLSKEHIHQHYGNKLRVRVCGILIENERLLVIKHDTLGENNYLWAPPGGGVEYGESVKEALKREFKEEVGLEVEVKKYLFTHEFLQPPLHAIELFFEVERLSGEIIQGSDPEMDAGKQLIREVRFKSIEEINSENAKNMHHVIQHLSNWDDLLYSEKGFIS